MTKIKRVLPIILLVFASMFQACELDPAKSVEENVAAAGDYLLGEEAFFDVYRVIDRAARDTALWAKGGVLIDSALVSLLPGDAGIQLDYGDSNVVCPDGKLRRGIILVNMLGEYFADSSEAIITFDNFFYEDNKIEGTQHIRHLGKNMNNDPELSLDIIDGKIITADGEIMFASSKVMVWLEGDETFEDVSDDAYSLLSEGTIDGMSSMNTEFHLVIMEDLVYRRSCEWIESGIIRMNLTGLLIEEGVIEFGEGECDSRVLLIFDGIEVPFYLE